VLIEFDAGKDAVNRDKHGISLARAADFEFETANISLDIRRAYAEERYQALGYIRDRLHVLVFTLRNDRVRAISLRKANPREVRRYVHQP
jgi:hypothetical protein